MPCDIDVVQLTVNLWWSKLFVIRTFNAVVNRVVIGCQLFERAQLIPHRVVRVYNVLAQEVSLS